MRLFKVSWETEVKGVFMIPSPSTRKSATIGEPISTFHSTVFELRSIVTRSPRELSEKWANSGRDKVLFRVWLHLLGTRGALEMTFFGSY